MVQSQYGTHGDLVERFVVEVRQSTPADWSRYLDRLAQGVPGRRGLFRTLDPRLDAAMDHAVDSAADDAFRSLGLTRAMFPENWARFIALETDVITAAKVIAAGDKVPHDSRRALLGPFADVGFTAAAAALERLDR
ncbi:hypothetical protein [Cellulomonas sp. URHB0016]